LPPSKKTSLLLKTELTRIAFGLGHQMLNRKGFGSGSQGRKLASSFGKGHTMGILYWIDTVTGLFI
ncbi:MAG: hypothetical protein ACR2HF_08830, partial [Methylococcaceae bacterium]